MFRSADLISAEYAGEQRLLHTRPKGYGGKGDKWADGVVEIAKAHGCYSVLDYGCGRGTLIATLRLRSGLRHLRFDEYDPGVPGKDSLPAFADLVVCTDVLEHIEPERLDAVLGHLQMLARRAIFLVVATRPSNKTLSDGRNAHLTVESAEWWTERVSRGIGWPIHPGPPSPLRKPSREWVAVLCPS